MVSQHFNFQLLSSDPEPQDQNNASSINNEPSQPHQQQQGERDNFAYDFFRCGIDCSSLLLLQNHHDDTSLDSNKINGTDYINPCNGNPNSERKLKQANLFQMPHPIQFHIIINIFLYYVYEMAK